MELKTFYADYSFEFKFLHQRYAKLRYKVNMEGTEYSSFWVGLISGMTTSVLTTLLDIHFDFPWWVVAVTYIIFALLISVGALEWIEHLGTWHQRVFLNPKKLYVEPFEIKLIERKMETQFRFETDYDRL